jgi:ABC-2 type transport system ATP-binding protein
VDAVRSISFSIQPGEVTGFIGPNGAGKTTTLKMLAGLLYPTSGEARVAGWTPWERRPGFLRGISMVLGNKSQMLWDIPPLDTFRVLAEIYAIPPAEYRRTLDELVTLLEMGELLAKPVRNLSLGERMKCELVAACCTARRCSSWTSPPSAWTSRCRPACAGSWASTTAATARR